VLGRAGSLGAAAFDSGSRVARGIDATHDHDTSRPALARDDRFSFRLESFRFKSNPRFTLALRSRKPRLKRGCPGSFPPNGVVPHRHRERPRLDALSRLGRGRKSRGSWVSGKVAAPDSVQTGKTLDIRTGRRGRLRDVQRTREPQLPTPGRRFALHNVRTRMMTQGIRCAHIVVPRRRDAR
jgi:hypothetical protein